MAVTIMVVDGEEIAVGYPTPEEIEAMEGELRDPNEPRDPEGWRKYSDVMTPEQIEYLRRHPRDEDGEENEPVEEPAEEPAEAPESALLSQAT